MNDNKMKFLEYNYYINGPLTSINLDLAINNFLIELLINLRSKKNICILFKVQTYKGDILNVSPLYIENIDNLKNIKEVLIFYWSSVSNINKMLNIKKVILLYKFISSDIEYVDSVFKCDKKLILVDILPEDFTNLPRNKLLET
jgi:hypothetical protein